MDKYTRWADVPGHLKTRTQLAKEGLRPAPDQQPAGRKTGGYGPYDLYDRNQAIPKAEPTPAQLAALEKARQQAALNSRCAHCGAPFFNDGRYKTEDTGQGAYICFICNDRQQAGEWAYQFLADPGAIILDTETTGLDDDAQIVEIAIINSAGEVLLNTLVRPTIKIPAAVTAIHGISDSDVAGAPAWPAIDTRVFEILGRASQIAIYNADYDLRLIGQTRAAHGLAEWSREQIWWLEGQPKVRCAMKIYAMWFGDWSDYHRSYRWQKLQGGHRALGDCLATLEYIKEMANDDQN